MHNKIIYLTKKEYKKYNFPVTDNLFIISGADCQKLSDYFNQVYYQLNFPLIDINKSIDTYFDWIRDLSWLSGDEIVFIINDFDILLKNDLNNKQIVMDLFQNEILPWWEDGVTKCVVEGKPRKFNVYIISE